MQTAGHVLRVVTLTAIVAVGALFADDATESAILAQAIADATASASFYKETIFLLQCIGITEGFLLGFAIWSCWLRGRQAKNP